MKAILDQEAMRIATIADTTGTRPVLGCVKIGNGEIVVVDGYMLARKSIETEGEGEILVEAADILKAKKVGGRELEKILINADEKTITDKDGKVDASFEPLQANYPDLEQIYPTSERKASIALSSSLLVKLLKVVGMNTTIKLRVRGTTDPVEFVAGNVSGLIMPMRIPEEDEHWHKEKK